MLALVDFLVGRDMDIATDITGVGTDIHPLMLSHPLLCL